MKPTSRSLLAAVVALSLSLPLSAATLDDLVNAAKLGDAVEIATLVSRGMDPNSTDANGNTLLIIAAREEQAKAVEELLKYRVKVNARNTAGDTALMLASLKGYTVIVQKLIDAGAAYDHKGWNPLLYASFEGCLSVVELLLAKGANANATAPSGATALMFAARNGHQDVVARLLKAGAAVDTKNDQGDTAQSWALKSNNTDIAELLSAPPKASAQ